MFLNLSSILLGMNPWITAKCLVPPGFLKVSRTSFATSASSCNTRISRLIFFLIPAICFAICACFAVSSFSFASALVYASDGICDMPSGMENGFALKPLSTLSAFSESSIPQITRIAALSLLSKSYL